jgi:hypothetical protein
MTSRESCRCGAPLVVRRGLCLECLSVEEARQLQAAFDAAEKVPLSQYRGKYITVETDDDEINVAEAGDVDDWERDGCNVLADGTRFVWGTTPEPAVFDLEEYLHDYLSSEHHEDASDWVDSKKIAEAQILVDEALRDVVTYMVDRSIAVIVPPETP